MKKRFSRCGIKLRQWKCGICNKIFSSQMKEDQIIKSAYELLKDHFKDLHPEVLIKCQHDNELFLTIDELRKYEKNKYPKIKKVPEINRNEFLKVKPRRSKKQKKYDIEEESLNRVMELLKSGHGDRVMEKLNLIFKDDLDERINDISTLIKTSENEKFNHEQIDDEIDDEILNGK